MAVDVEQVSFPRVAVADVRHPLDVVPADGKRREQDTGEGKAAAQPGGHPGVDGGAPTGTEALAQGVVDRRAARSPRQATTTSPTVARTATPNAAQPPGESTSPWLNASNVEARSQ
jgi:hypothetical protein